MTVPNPAAAQALLLEAETMNPGAWVAHSRNVARAARFIAQRHPTLDPERAHTLGLLHDLGRRTGPNRDRHILDGYDHLMALGYPDAARIALTHSFVNPQLSEREGVWDGTSDEWERLRGLLAGLTFAEEDRLFQLCDTLALPDGFCIVEERLIDVALRHGVNDHSVSKWRAKLALKRHFDQVCGGNLYRLLPGLCERLS
ncbi:metal-dependent phosphohydrolase [Deinococcus koreensis]|uniref:Metal-dependent phosphohydrolase n=1 Tax=Deinococcus koreensis TaxID=2054903 RepID=A0A2K3V204_9DEIO|nr:metal-dependent phosphohydrolase [Deinococcus koreensis]